MYSQFIRLLWLPCRHGATSEPALNQYYLFRAKPILNQSYWFVRPPFGYGFHLCQLLRESAKRIYLGGTPPIMPLWGEGQEVRVLKWEEREMFSWFYYSLSVSEFTFTVCVRIYIHCLCQNLHQPSILNLWHFGNPVPFWHLLLSPGVPAYIKAPQ